MVKTKTPYVEGIEKSLGIKKEEAVSPVIATILMVAITVVLAATVYILVSHYATTGQTPFTGSLAVLNEAQGSNYYVYNLTLTYSTPSSITVLPNFHLLVNGQSPGTLSGSSFSDAKSAANPSSGTPPLYVAYITNPDGTTAYYDGATLTAASTNGATSIESGATITIVSKTPLSGYNVQVSLSGYTNTPSVTLP